MHHNLFSIYSKLQYVAQSRSYATPLILMMHIKTIQITICIDISETDDHRSFTRHKCIMLFE